MLEIGSTIQTSGRDATFYSDLCYKYFHFNLVIFKSHNCYQSQKVIYRDGFGYIINEDGSLFEGVIQMNSPFYGRHIHTSGNYYIGMYSIAKINGSTFHR